MHIKQFKYLLFNWEFMFGHQQDKFAADTMACSDNLNLCKAESIWDLIKVGITVQHNLKMTKEPEGISNKVMSLTKGLYLKAG